MIKQERQFDESERVIGKEIADKKMIFFDEIFGKKGENYSEYAKVRVVEEKVRVNSIENAQILLKNVKVRVRGH